jgi:hypothetical protein
LSAPANIPQDRASRAGVLSCWIEGTTLSWRA